MNETRLCGGFFVGWWGKRQYLNTEAQEEFVSRRVRSKGALLKLRVSGAPGGFFIVWGEWEGGARFFRGAGEDTACRGRSSRGTRWVCMLKTSFAEAVEGGHRKRGGEKLVVVDGDDVCWA